MSDDRTRIIGQTQMGGMPTQMGAGRTQMGMAGHAAGFRPRCGRR